MKIRQLLSLSFVLGLWALALTAEAAGPMASPESAGKSLRPETSVRRDKAFGDPTDLKAAAIAAADYVRHMQADVTEDNAGNGPAGDLDPDDAGWDWVVTPFEHSAGSSSLNLYGVTANGMLQVHAFNPDPALFVAMQDAADHIVAAGPSSIRSAADFTFLMDFAALPGVASPGTYQAGAEAIWLYRLANYGGTATSFAGALRDFRGVTNGYPNGIIPWDLAPWATGLMNLDALFPGNGYAAQAAEVAEVMYQDSFALVPGYFDVFGRCQGYDPAYANVDYYWYPHGVSGLIEAFASVGVHTGEIPALEAALLACQYGDGAFGYQYGAPADIDDRDWQGTAYSMACLNSYLAPTAGNLASLRAAGEWLAATQDPSGGFVYGNLTHYPEIGGECAAALAMAHQASAAAVTASGTFADPAQCGVTGQVTFHYDRNDATPGLFGYEMVVSISGPVAAVAPPADFHQVAPMSFFRVDDNLDGTYTVNATRYGVDPGLLVDADLFSIDLTTAGAGTVDVSVLSYRMRDPQNEPLFADVSGSGFDVDCTAPLPVAGITAAPKHEKVVVNWTHNGADTATYEIYRGLWYDNTLGVSAYPEYDDLPGNTIPTRPADRAAAAGSGEWVHAGTVNVGTNTFIDNPLVAIPRGVYYYEVFAVDAALNASVAAPANDRATNYWLGDVSPIDGYVGIDDITALGTAFATSDGPAPYNNVIDVGPTDDQSAKGIPTTDSKIDFEDLMIFALNFSVVSPAKAGGVISESIALAWTQREDGRWALSLVEGTGLQGVRVRANHPASTVQAGDLLASQGERSFLVNVGRRLDVNLALMGQGASLVGNGELFVVDSAAEIMAADLVIDLRGNDNTRLAYTLDKLSGAQTPMVFSLAANFPNPFNPMTRISFTLPGAQPVNLAVYSLDGRKVTTLVNETRGPGLHEVVWTGRDDAGQNVASGLYFYRIDAGPYSQVHKMTLMK